jgi:serine phosphatase RsbU (regulator of sigma subunit)/nitrate/nitrite-specific signal transduction histidine kinase
MPTAAPAAAEAAHGDRLRTELAQQQRNFRLLREIARRSRGAVDPQEVFETIYERLKAALPIDAFFVALCDSDDARQYHFALFVDEGRRVQTTDKRVGGLTGWILGLKESRLYRDLHVEIEPDAPRPERFGNAGRLSRSWIGVPLMIGRESVGVISVQSYAYGVYSEADLQLVEALADLAAVAIDNALLYQQQEELSKSLAARVVARSEELAVLTAIASGLSRGQYDEARLTEAIERILWMLNLDAGVVWLAEPSGGLRRAAAYAVAGRRHAGSESSAEQAPDPITAQVYRDNTPVTGRSQFSTGGYHIQTAFGFLQEAAGDEDPSVFAVPLQAHGQSVGVLTLYGAAGRELLPHEYSLLEAAGQQMAIGVENARLYHDTRTAATIAQQRADNLALVHRISRLVSSSLDPVEVVRITAEQMVRLLDVDHCAIMLFDEAGARGEVVAEFPALGALGGRATFGAEDYLEAEPGRGRPGYVTDIAGDPRVRAVREIALRLGVQATLLVPLISRGRSVGAVSLNQIHTTRAFSDEELELCRTTAAQVAIALENARLFQMSVTHVEQEMQIARSIQANLFPRALPPIPNAALAGRCLPALETGGDFYDVLPLGQNRFGFSIGDVSGKSLPAAMLMAVARSIVRSEALDHAMPERVVTETNGLVAQDVPPNTFVSLCYAVYEADTRRLVLANAGHLTPLIRRANGVVEWSTVDSNFPLGIEPHLEYAANSVELAAGDSVLFLTDGLVEAFAPDGTMFGFERLQQLYAECGDWPAEEVVTLLLDTVCDWQDSDHRNDDMTAVVLQVR